MTGSGQNATQPPQRHPAAAVLEGLGHAGETLLQWQKHGSLIQNQETLMTGSGQNATLPPQRHPAAALLEGLGHAGETPLQWQNQACCPGILIPALGP